MHIYMLMDKHTQTHTLPYARTNWNAEVHICVLSETHTHSCTKGFACAHTTVESCSCQVQRQPSSHTCHLSSSKKNTLRKKEKSKKKKIHTYTHKEKCHKDLIKSREEGNNEDLVYFLSCSRSERSKKGTFHSHILKWPPQPFPPRRQWKIPSMCQKQTQWT